MNDTDELTLHAWKTRALGAEEYIRSGRSVLLKYLGTTMDALEEAWDRAHRAEAEVGRLKANVSDLTDRLSAQSRK